MKNIKHRPLYDTEKIIAHYIEKDRVPIKYVCTSALGGEETAMDIFYRDTPHPEFGNHYFGIYNAWWMEPNQMFITNADKIEDAKFEMVEVNGELHYSQHRHDFYTIGDVSIDGGRAYLRLVGNIDVPVVDLRVKDGEFVEWSDNK